MRRDKFLLPRERCRLVGSSSEDTAQRSHTWYWRKPSRQEPGRLTGFDCQRITNQLESPFSVDDLRANPPAEPRDCPVLPGSGRVGSDGFWVDPRGTEPPPPTSLL
jgi:hypothetical protein